MLVLRGTKKLRDRIKGIAARPDDAPAATLVARVPEAIATALANQGASAAFIAAELAAMGEVCIASTNDRSTVGVMNEFAFQGEFHVFEGLTDLEALSYRMSSLSSGPLTTATAHPTVSSLPCCRAARRMWSSSDHGRHHRLFASPAATARCSN